MPFVIAYNFADMITTRFNKRGFHPGVHVALDLIICGALAFSTTFDLYAGFSDRAIAPSAAAGVIESAVG